MKIVVLSLALAFCLIAIALLLRAKPGRPGARSDPAGDATVIAAVVAASSASVDCGSGSGSDGGACH